MSTRRAKPGSPPRQERFASAYPSGLLANLVAKCAALLDPAARATIWFLQWLSWQPGGLRVHFGAALERELFALCLDPNFSNPGLLEKAEAYRVQWIQKKSGGAETIIGRRVAEALSYARETRCLTLIDGAARIGKTFAARRCSERSAGLVRLCQTPFSNDDTSFFRAIGRALGVSSSLQLKAAEIRARVEDVLQCGDLTLILDEAAWLWPQTGRHYSLPARVNWLTTALVNFGVPVVLIVTEQFHISQKRVVSQTGWASEQFTGRIGHVERLPEILPMSDLIAVAGALFPEGDAKSWRALAAYADLSQMRLAAIDALANRARWHAKQSGRAVATPADLSCALQESTLPSDPRLTKSASTSRQGIAVARRDMRGPLAPATRRVDRRSGVTISRLSVSTPGFDTT